jgi:pantoate--beta-alanine ligase
MGNLHQGHLALVREARRLADRVVVSIFVNPTQFGPGEDFASYPRTPGDDLEKLETEGAHLAFLPDAATVYPHGLQDAVRVLATPSLATILEGESRPGHFDGVVTVVARLFNLVQPDVAVFGEKDYQQLLVIRRMARDLGYPTAIHGVETVREPEGLAMSSRNAYLGPAQRELARHINILLDRLVLDLESGREDFATLEEKAMDWLNEKGLQADYVAIRKAADLQVPAAGDAPLRVLAAARAGDTRLIDNKCARNVCNQRE